MFGIERKKGKRKTRKIHAGVYELFRFVSLAPCGREGLECINSRFWCFHPIEIAFKTCYREVNTDGLQKRKKN